MNKLSLMRVATLGGALALGAVPMTGLALCLQDSSGAEYNVDVVGGTLLAGSIEVPQTCPAGPLSGSFVQSGNTFEIGWSAHFNTLTTGCVPQAILSATLGSNLQGGGVVLFMHTDGSIDSAEVDIGPCGMSLGSGESSGLWVEE
jgi:hypothetical protein